LGYEELNLPIKEVVKAIYLFT